MRLHLLLVAAAAVSPIACASHGGAASGGGAPGAGATPAPVAPPVPTAATPAAPPQARSGDALRLGPSALRYLVHRRIHAEQQLQGRTVTLDRGVRAFVSATINGPADSLGYALTLTIDSLVADSGTLLPPTINLGAVRGLWYSGHVSPAGALRNVLPSDSTLAWTAAQVFGSFQGFYPRLPPAGLTLAAEWIDTVTTVDRSTVEVTTTSINHARATAWEQHGGIRCLRLEVNSTFRLAGAGQMGGQPREVSGSGTRSTIQFIAIDGRYLGGEIRDSLAITTRFPVEGETVPGTQLSQVTVTVLP